MGNKHSGEKVRGRGTESSDARTRNRLRGTSRSNSGGSSRGSSTSELVFELGATEFHGMGTPDMQGHRRGLSGGSTASDNAETASMSRSSSGRFSDRNSEESPRPPHAPGTIQPRHSRKMSRSALQQEKSVVWSFQVKPVKGGEPDKPDTSSHGGGSQSDRGTTSAHAPSHSWQGNPFSSRQSAFTSLESERNASGSLSQRHSGNLPLTRDAVSELSGMVPSYSGSGGTLHTMSTGAGPSAAVMANATPTRPQLTVQSAAALAASFGLQVEIVGKTPPLQPQLMQPQAYAYRGSDDRPLGSGALAARRQVQAESAEEEEEGEDGEGAVTDPPLVDEDVGQPLDWAEVEALRHTQGNGGEASEDPLHDAAPGSFRSVACWMESSARFGSAAPLVCGQLPEAMPAIRPSRLGICPGHAPEKGPDVHFVAVAGRGGGAGAHGQDDAEGEEEGEEEEEDEEELDAQAMEEAIEAAHEVFSTDATTTAIKTCEGLLASLLDITESTFGFIASHTSLTDGSPCLKTHAITNVMWTDKLRSWYTEHVRDGLVFTHVDEEGLFGRAALQGQAVIDNNPNNDACPKGHPRVNGMAAIPLICGPSIVGVAVVANRIGGYGQALLLPLQPLLTTIANILFAVSWRADCGRSIRALLTPIHKEGTFQVTSDGRIPSLDPQAQAIFGYSPAHLLMQRHNLMTGQLGQARGGQLQLKDLFPVLKELTEEVLDSLATTPQTVVGRQQGGQRILLRVKLKLRGENSSPHLASVQVLLHQ